MGFVACEKSIEELPATAFGNSAILKVGESINYINPTSNHLRLSVIDILNNFCPKGLNCLLAGYAEVKLSINSQNNQNVAFSLFFGDYHDHPKKLGFKPDTLDFNLNKKAYRAILKSIKTEENNKELKAEVLLFEK